MFDFDTLEQQEDYIWYNGKLVSPSIDDKARHGAVAEARPDRGPSLDNVVKEKLRDHGPAAWVLHKWSRCQLAKHIIRSFVLEDAVESTELIRFREVQRLLRDLKWSSSDLARFFVGDNLDFGKPDDVAREILKILAVVDGSSGDALGFNMLFRLLEALGHGLEDFLRAWDTGSYTEGQQECRGGLRAGRYQLLRCIGSGFTGMCIYQAEHVDTRLKAAVKWPVGQEELAAMRDIQAQRPPRCLGLPDPLDWGTLSGQPYVVTELLGSPITKVLRRLEDCPFERRWQVVKLIGRLVLRRLQALHGCGHVHCDVSPENILLGAPRTAGRKKAHAGGALPYLIDFGLAQRHPGGEPLDGDHGSAEWSSVRSAAGARRRPEDDLEALGWIMVNGLFGDLPWFGLLGEAYQLWGSSRAHRIKAVRKAQELKLRLLDDGWDSMGSEWSALGRMPARLAMYFQACRSDRATGRPPDYGSLAGLLGGMGSASLEEAEQEDFDQFQHALAEVL